MWTLTIVGALIGALWFVVGTAIAGSAVQSAAVAAQATALAVLPYVIARARDAGRRPGGGDSAAPDEAETLRKERRRQIREQARF